MLHYPPCHLPYLWYHSPSMSTIRLLTLTEYLSLPCPEKPWLVEGLIPQESFVVLWGPPKAGKTLLALQVGLGISRSGTVLGRASHQGPVLLLELDTGHRLLRTMLDNVRHAGIDVSGPLYLPHPDDLRGHYPVNLLHDQSHLYVHSLISLCKPSLVIVDCLRELGDHDENESGETKKIVSALKQLTVFHPQHPCACLLLHHTKKLALVDQRGQPIDHDPIDVGRGSSYLAGAVDSVWFLHNNVLKVVPRFTEPSQYRLKQGPGGWWALS